MWEASWRRALRTSMCSLRSGWSQRRDAFGCFFQSGAHALPRRPSNHIVAIERRRKRNRGIKILPELFTKLAQIFERQVTEFHALLNGKSHRVADLLVRLAKRNSLMNQVGGGRHG